VCPQPIKTDAVAACPRPTTKKKVRAFLGMASYYRRFIPAFAELTSPLTDLTQQGASDPVQWIEHCQMAFERVKKALVGSHSYLHLTLSSPLSYRVTCRTEGWAPPDELEQPVLYLSRKLPEREERYSVVEKECLAINWGVNALLPPGACLHPLFGSPLRWLHRMKDTNPASPGGTWHYSQTILRLSTGRGHRWFG